MHASRLNPLWLAVLALTLASCGTFRPTTPAFVPPRIECGELAPPPHVDDPPDAGTTDWRVWAINDMGLRQAIAALIEQRIGTAVCLQQNRNAGNIR
jgi:hypothetical protein